MSETLFALQPEETTLVVRYSPAMVAKYDDRLEYIGRWNRYYGLQKSIWHNPFSVREHGERALPLYARHVYSLPGLFNWIVYLKGQVLACWCKPGRCHGDLLAAVANQLPAYAKPEIVIGFEDKICNFCFQHLSTSHHAEFCAYFVNVDEVWRGIVADWR
jgi:hypothetical protein